MTPSSSGPHCAFRGVISFRGWLTCLSFKILSVRKKNPLNTSNSIQTECWPNVFYSFYRWVDSNSGHLLHCVRRPSAAIIHISTDFNLNRQSWDRPCIYESVRLDLSEVGGSCWFSLKFLKKAWTQMTLPELRQYGRHHCLARIPFASV